MRGISRGSLVDTLWRDLWVILRPAEDKAKAGIANEPSTRVEPQLIQRLL